jgi:hypothetical protein
MVESDEARLRRGWYWTRRTPPLDPNRRHVGNSWEGKGCAYRWSMRKGGAAALVRAARRRARNAPVE